MLNSGTVLTLVHPEVPNFERRLGEHEVEKVYNNYG